MLDEQLTSVLFMQVQILKLLTSHRLMTNVREVPGCLPWFALADTGMRTWVAYVRRYLVSKHANSSSLASTTATTTTAPAKSGEDSSLLEQVVDAIAKLIALREEDAELMVRIKGAGV